MQIQVNTDESIDGGEDLSARVSAEIHSRLDRFSQHITRIEVHLSDEDGDKSGGSDKRCLIEARLEGRQPEVASENMPPRLKVHIRVPPRSCSALLRLPSVDSTT